MSYWPGELVQTLSINGNQLSINPGNTVTLPGGGSVSSFTTVDAEIGSISSLTVSSFSESINLDGNNITNVATLSTNLIRSDTINNDNTIYTTVLVANGINTTNFTAYSTVNAATGNFSTINTNVLNATSTIHAISTISSTTLEAQAIVNLSSINGQSLSTLAGAGDWSLYPAQSTVQMAGNNLLSTGTIVASTITVSIENPFASAYPNEINLGTNEDNILGVEANRMNNVAGFQANFQDLNTSTLVKYQIFSDVYGGHLNLITLDVSGAPTTRATFDMLSTINGGAGGFKWTDGDLQIMTYGNGILSTPSLYTSSINGAEFTTGGGGGITISTVTASFISTFSSEIRQGLFSSIVFNPTFNPQFNITVDTGFTAVGAGLGTVGAGLLALAVALPVAGYNLGYGLGKGLNSASEPRQINYINSNNYEVYKFGSQLQISTLGTQISTIFRTIETIPSTIMDLNGSTIATSTNIEVFTSTISSEPPFLAMRAVGDPLQFVSTPWSWEQDLNNWSWVEIPAGGSTSTINVSTLSLSTLELFPSTILKGDLPNTLQVLGADGEYNQVNAQGFQAVPFPGSGNSGTFTVNTSNNPLYIDSNFSTFRFALQGTQVPFSEVDFPVFNGNNSTIQNLSITNAPEPILTYAQYPPGFPSTTIGKIKFLSSIEGSYGGVQILSQFDSNSRIDVGQNIYATDLIVGSNTGFPLTVLVPQIQGYPLLAMSSIGAGGVASAEVIGLTSTNTGQLVIAAPNTATSTTTRIMYLDSASTCVGIGKPAPQATLDVSGSISSYTIATSNINVSSINGSAYPPALPTDIYVNNLTASNSAIINGFTINEGNLAISQNIISTVGAGEFITTFSNLAAPTGIFTCINNLDTTPGLRGKAALFMNGGISSIGVNKIPEAGYSLDVEGALRTKVGHFTGQVFTSSIFAPSTFCEMKSATGTVELTPESSWWVGVNSGIVAGDNQGLLRTGKVETGNMGYNGTEYYNAPQLYPGFYSAGWTNLIGRPIKVEYSGTTDNSFGGGLGKAEFPMPIGLSTLACAQGTYVAFGDSNPGLTHPIWLYSTINDANGLISTVQMGGGQNTDLFVSVLGYV